MDAELSLVKDTLSAFQQDLADQKADLDELYTFIGDMYGNFDRRLKD